MALIGCVAAHAQSPAPGWTLVLRIIPNPLPVGRCASVQVEVRDAQGYRTDVLSNGGAIDFHTFRYTADTTNFQWQNGDPITGIICTRATATAAKTTITVTMPDGLSGSVDLSSLLPGQVATPVRYPPQAPLRIAGVPPPNGMGAATAPAIAVPKTAPTVTATVPSGGAGASASASPPVRRMPSGALVPKASTPNTSNATSGGATGTTPGCTATAATGQPSGDGTSSGPPLPHATLTISTSALVLNGSNSACGPRVVIAPMTIHVP